MKNGEEYTNVWLDPLQYGIEIYLDYIAISDVYYNVEYDDLNGVTYVSGGFNGFAILDSEINWDVHPIDKAYPEATFSYGLKQSIAENVVYRSGMTWRSFCESEYNTVGFRIDKHPVTGEDVILTDMHTVLINSYDIYPKPTDLIEPIFYIEY